MSVLRTVEEILAHADELAARFEDYGPNPADELDVAAIRQLRAALANKSAAERHLLDAVEAASVLIEVRTERMDE